ncbi:LysR family transcriptional regulator, partial [Caballeronia sp. INDeC2]|uniref:LysR family transcriptional regulator n=1 Tax=Caballeronia sp. INDeC2 TaxID=2921747 RepID=UPI00202867AB
MLVTVAVAKLPISASLSSCEGNSLRHPATPPIEAPLSAHNDGISVRQASYLNSRRMKPTQRNPLLRRFSYLLSIDEHRNFTRAAEALNVSQSA